MIFLYCEQCQLKIVISQIFQPPTHLFQSPHSPLLINFPLQNLLFWKTFSNPPPLLINSPCFETTEHPSIEQVRHVEDISTTSLTLFWYFIVNFEESWFILLLFSLCTLNRQITAVRSLLYILENVDVANSWSFLYC